MEPVRPCPYCSSTQFGVIERVSCELLSGAKIKIGNVLFPDFTVRVCTGCGATAFFNTQGAANLLTLCRHRIVEAGDSQDG